jgi:hypothetical protein
MILMLEYDKRGGWRYPMKVERVGPMTRTILGWWSIAVFRGCGINDVSAAFRAHERDLLVQQGRLADNSPAATEGSAP